MTYLVATFRDTFLLSDSSISLFKRFNFLLLFLHVERTQQAFEALFILLRVSPVLEVADMPTILDIPGPCFATGHDGLIDSHRIQHIRYALWFFLQGSFDFIGNPTTCNRVLRQDQQQLIIQPDRLVNTVPDLISNVHVLWGKPTAYPFLLQVVVQPSNEQLILARIANEASVVVDGFSIQRANMLHEDVIYPYSAQKQFWDITLRACKSTGSKGRIGFVFDRFNSLDCAQVYIAKNGPSEGCFTEVVSVEIDSTKISFDKIGSAKIGIAEVSFAEVGSAEVGSAEIDSAEIGSAEIGSAEVDSFEVDFSKVEFAEVGFAEVGFAEVNITEVNFAETDSVEDRSTKIGSTKIGSTKIGSAEVGFTEVGPAEGSFTEVDSAEIGSVEVGSAEIGSAEIGSAKVSAVEGSFTEVGFTEVGPAEGSFAEVCFAEVNRCCYTFCLLLCSPSVPFFYSSFEYVQLFLNCHVFFSLSYALIIK